MCVWSIVDFIVLLMLRTVRKIVVSSRRFSVAGHCGACSQSARMAKFVSFNYEHSDDERARR